VEVLAPANIWSDKVKAAANNSFSNIALSPIPDAPRHFSSYTYKIPAFYRAGCDRGSTYQ